VKGRDEDAIASLATCPLGMKVITEIDARPGDPSCGLHTRARVRARPFVWRPPPPAPRERVIDLLDTRYVGYRYECYRRSRVRDTIRTPACHRHPRRQIRMARLTPRAHPRGQCGSSCASASGRKYSRICRDPPCARDATRSKPPLRFKPRTLEHARVSALVTSEL
jgi:hypothetical protein